ARCEVLLEGAARCEHAVSAKAEALVCRAAGDQHSDGKDSLSTRPCTAKSFESFALVLDHVEHEPEVHDVGFSFVFVWSKVWIPAGGRDADRGEPAHVVASPTPVIEER